MKMKGKHRTEPRGYVQEAIKKGQLPRLNGSIKCVDCGDIAHCYDHRDYAKPLDVEPVCYACNGSRGPALNLEYSKQAVQGRKISARYQQSTYPQKCNECSYQWQSRIITPKACPLCKRYLKTKIRVKVIKDVPTRFEESR